MTPRDALSVVLVWAAVTLGGCRADGAHSPTCGLAQLAGPALIQQQLVNVPFVLTEAPRGLPGTLPARVAAHQDLSEHIMALKKQIVQNPSARRPGSGD